MFTSVFVGIIVISCHNDHTVTFCTDSSTGFISFSAESDVLWSTLFSTYTLTCFCDILTDDAEIYEFVSIICQQGLVLHNMTTAIFNTVSTSNLSLEIKSKQNQNVRSPVFIPAISLNVIELLS